MFSQFISALKRELQGDLPGMEAQFRMAPSGRISFPQGMKPLSGSVLLLLYPAESIHIVMIKRTDYHGPHSGQIAFPGGKAEKDDPDLIHTALREAGEETGVDTSKINIVGNITPLYIPVSNFSIFPVIGYLEKEPLFNPDTREVKYLITPVLDEFLQEGAIRQKAIMVRDQEIIAPYYQIRNEEVWGATAMIMSEFLEIARNLL